VQRVLREREARVNKIGRVKLLKMGRYINGLWEFQESRGSEGKDCS